VATVHPSESLPDLERPHKWIHYGSSGLELGSEDSRFSGNVNVRGQLRLSEPFESAPRRESQLEQPGESTLGFRRARFKVDGHIAVPWIQYKYEHDLVGGNLLDLRFDVGPEWMTVRFGQWKA